MLLRVPINYLAPPTPKQSVLCGGVQVGVDIFAICTPPHLTREADALFFPLLRLSSARVWGNDKLYDLSRQISAELH
jgi:hypothetical protein